MSDGITIHDYNPDGVPEGQTWDRDQLTQDFDVLGFSMGYVVVRRKSDGVRGSLEFTHMPRVYYNFQEG